MRVVITTLAIFWLTGAGLILCSRAVPPQAGLPHRPITALTNWGQGRNPGAGRCPAGTIEFDLDDSTFLECMRGYTND